MTDQTQDSPDARWQRLADADLAGELLTPHERELLAAHEAADPLVREEQRVRRELAARGRDDLVDRDADERLIASAVADFMAAPAAARPLHVVPAGPEKDEARPRRRRAPWLAAGVLLAASVALVWALRAPQREPLSILSGDPIVGAAAAVPGASLADADELRADREPACVGAPGRVRACLSPGSRARVLPEGALELLEGQADVTVDLAVTQFVMQVAGVRVTSDAATYTLAVRSGVWSAAARRGTVTLADAAGPLARLGPGDRMTRADASAADPLTLPTPVPPDSPPVPSDSPTTPVPSGTPPVPSDTPPVPSDTPSVPPDSPDVTAPATGATTPAPARPGKREPPPADLLAQAREHRAAGRVADAARAYERLVKTHPDSPLAGTALLALGQLYLGAAADPGAALRAFDRYLERGGPLAEEAAYGRISALTRLGRKADARAAIDRFLARYPASSYADTLRRQLDP